MKRKIIALCLIVAMLGVAVVGSTLAYFTDTAEATNVFTVGKIDIDLIEEVDVLSSTGKSLAADKLVYDETGAQYIDIMPTNKLQKEVTIRNNDAPAYVRVTVMVNHIKELDAAIDGVYEKDGKDSYVVNGETLDDAGYIQYIYDQIFEDWNIRYAKTNDAGEAIGMRLSMDAMPEKVLHIDSVKTTAVRDAYFIAYDNWFRSEYEAADTYGYKDATKGYYAQYMNPYELMYVYYLYLDEDEETTLFTGLNCPAEFNEKQAKFFDGLQINVYADAIQAESFYGATADAAANAKKAFEALNATHSLGDVLGREQNGATVIQGVAVNNAEDLRQNLKDGKDVGLTDDVDLKAAEGGYNKAGIVQDKGQTIDGNGNTLNTSGANGTWDCGVYTNGGTIKNLTISGSFRGIFSAGVNEDLYVENVVLDKVCYTFNVDYEGPVTDYTANFTDCTINGWTSYNYMFKIVNFTDCSFGAGTGAYTYAFCRPYGATAFVGCDFEAGYEIEPIATVTFEDCTIAGEPLTAANLATLVTSNIANATVIG